MALLPYFRWILFKDEISYIAIAGRYADGDPDAVNSYWAPLLSWLLAVPIALGVSPFFAAKVLSVLVGLAALLAFRRLLSTFSVGGWLGVILELSLIPALLFAALRFVTPDLLLAAVVVGYLSVILDSRYGGRRWGGAWCGLAGALAFFTKSYALFFFLAHFTVMSGLHGLRASGRGRARVVRSWVTGVAVFLALVAPWAGLLTARYGTRTLGVNSSYNHAIVGPESKGRPIFWVGLVPPAKPGDTSIWEDPHIFGEWVEAWSPLGSPGALVHQGKLIAKNLNLTLSALSSFTLLMPAILVGAAAVCAGGRPFRDARLPLFGGLFTFLVYPAGYLLVHSEDRYLLPLLLLGVAMAGAMLGDLFSAARSGFRARKAVLLVSLAASLMLTPLFGLATGANAGADAVPEVASQLEGRGLEGARLASNRPDFGGSVIVAHHLGAEYWGMVPEAPLPQVVEVLRSNGIEYYLVWDAEPIEEASQLRLVAEVETGKRELRVYAVGD
ncbi:MAG: ArnT family glycosyltransferase [Acidimicrobiales bacterium]